MSINDLVYQLHLLSRPFRDTVNTKELREKVTTIFSIFLRDLVDKEIAYDYAVICDATNNSPERIARNELWIDVLAKANPSAEFMYIPIKVLNR